MWRIEFENAIFCQTVFDSAGVECVVCSSCNQLQKQCQILDLCFPKSQDRVEFIGVRP
jgi:hypothetical protein